MKNKLGVLFVALVLGGMIFAENYTKGIDLHLLAIPIGRTKLVNGEYVQKSSEVAGQFKLATYDCFLLNDMLGIYGALGVNLGGYTSSKAVGGKTYGTDAGLQVSFEFMVGPAFGVNLGGVRFQTGLAFHAVIGAAVGIDFGADDANSIVGNSIKATALGFALTPQFRFSADRRCSFLLGCDLAFDFPKKLTYVDGSEEEEKKFDKGFRFAATPYIGLGINF